MKSSTKWLFSILIFVLLGVSIFAISKMYLSFKKDVDDKKWYTETAKEITYDENDDNTDNGIAELALDNTDCIGWIRIENTKIDFPVMQTKSDPEFYLRRNFNKKHSNLGTPFADAACDIEYSKNIIIYGHNMKDGTMFSDLMKYKRKDYGINNPIIQLITPNGCNSYIVCAVAKVKPDDDWYTYINETDEEIFNKIKAKLQDEALYLINGELNYEDFYLTLSTCEYSQKDGRLIVIARRSDINC